MADLTPAELNALTPTERIQFLGGAYSPYTPASQFQQYTAGMAPGLGRAARGMMDPALTYYNLGLAGGAPQLRGGVTTPIGGTSGTSFLDYLRGGGFSSDAARMNPESALGRARQAGRYALMAPSAFATSLGLPEDFMEGTNFDTPLTTEQTQSLALRGLYGMGPEMASNQMRAASTMLGQQIAGGSPFGIAAPLKSALERVISDLYNARLAQGREGAGFLNWILGGGGTPVSTGGAAASQSDIGG